MIIECPNCNTSFNVPDTAISSEGRKVKCSRCQHVWLAKSPETIIPSEEPKQEALDKETSEQPANSTEPVPQKTETSQPEASIKAGQTNSDESTLPNSKAERSVDTNMANTKSPSKKRIALSLLIILILLGINIAGIAIFMQDKLREIEFFDNLYNKIGVFSSNGFELQDIKIQAQNLTTKPTLILRFRVVNKNDIKAFMPEVKVALYDHSGSSIKKHTINNNNAQLSSYESKSYIITFENIPNTINKVSLDIGNKIELLVR